MKMILYMAISANGMIAKLDDDTPWSDAELDVYIEKVKENGNLIVGRRTYEKMLHDTDKDGDLNLLGNPLVVVLTKNKTFKNHDNFVFADTASAAIEILKNKKFKTGMVAGGSKVDSLFIKENLIDEIYLDIEPVIFGKGIYLFNPDDFEYGLELMESKKIGKSGIQLHYRILKSEKKMLEN